MTLFVQFNKNHFFLILEMICKSDDHGDESDDDDIDDKEDKFEYYWLIIIMKGLGSEC